MNNPRATERRSCAWCGDYEDQHDENGCRICGRYQWEQGEYRCDRFYETHEEADAEYQRRLAEVST